MLLQLSISRHTLDRYRERIRPDLDLAACRAELDRRCIEFTGLRRNRRGDGTCYLICRSPPAFTLVAREIPSDDGKARFRTITCLDGTQHF